MRVALICRESGLAWHETALLPVQPGTPTVALTCAGPAYWRTTKATAVSASAAVAVVTTPGNTKCGGGFSTVTDCPGLSCSLSLTSMLSACGVSAEGRNPHATGHSVVLYCHSHTRKAHRIRIVGARTGHAIMPNCGE